MPSSFNLLTHNWLPVLFAGEPQPRDVAIREALARAPDIRKLVSASPLETIALHRLLLAIVHRVFPTPTEEDWLALWDAGHFDTAALDAYYEIWGPRFDLFDAEHPFFQAPALPAEYATTVAKLGHEFSSGNNPLLFDHSQDAAPEGLAPATAARLLVAQQSFAVGGLITRLPGQPPSAESSHLLKAAVVLCTGTNLFRTLVLNMVRVAGDEQQPFPFDPGKDAAAWEQDPPSAATRAPRGYLDLLTWQPRSVRLIPPGPDGLVTQAVIMNGYRFPAHIRPADHETMTAYTKREKAAANQDPEPPVGFRPEKALWRDSVALLQQGQDNRVPRTLRHLGDLRSNGYIDSSAVVGVAAFGLSSDRAKLFLSRNEEFPLPLAYLNDESLLGHLKDGIEAAENAEWQLRLATRRMAERALAPDGNADPARVRALVESLAPGRAYWPALDVPFRRFMHDLAGEYDEAHDFGEPARLAWRDAIQRSANEAFDLAARAMQTSGRGYRAAAEAEGAFRGGLYRALQELQPEVTT